MHVRCPHCRHPIEIVDDGNLDDLTCSSCGSSFSVISTESTDTYRPESHETVGHFTLDERLGIGAFGAVWRAKDTELDRSVAIKIPRKGLLDAEETEKFLREARAAAQLKHLGIVSVHEVGRDGDTVFIVSDLIDGLTLSDWLTGHRPTPREAAELCVKITDALHHAHEHGVIHRDIKPGNILLDRDGEPHLTDFGLAKREAGEITMTTDGQVLGTPVYMSPEQARGEGHTVDRRTDIYSMGVVLFELLTGERPFDGSKPMLIHQKLTEDAPRPRRIKAGVPRDLETICLKCLERDTDRRYSTAADLKEDLNRFLAGAPISARPIGRIARGWRWCKRNPSTAVALAAILATCVSTATAAVWINSLQQYAERHRQSPATLSDRDMTGVEAAQQGPNEPTATTIDPSPVEKRDGAVDAMAATAVFQVAFVIDGTDSMKAEIPSLANVIKQSARRHEAESRRAGAAAYAVVIYRDINSPSGNVSILTDFTTDLVRLKESLDGVQCESGEPFSREAVDQGIQHALTSLSWSEPESSRRHLVVCGDAPPYPERTYYRTFNNQELISLATKKGVSISGIVCDSVPRDDRKTQEVITKELPELNRFLTHLSQATGGEVATLPSEVSRDANWPPLPQ